MITWLQTHAPYILAGLAIALAVTGALYRLTEPTHWPTSVRWLGATSWYLLAAVGGALLYALTLGRRKTDGSTAGGKPASENEPDPVTTADDLAEQIDEAAEAEQDPNPSDLVDDLNELTEEQ